MHSYIGRFAPSPSGPLHFGSLVCALASYLDAKAHLGQWLVRIEDIDPPREQSGADELILHALRRHGLYWDHPIRYQSLQSRHYDSNLATLAQQHLTYRCNCTRKRLTSLHHSYDQHCLHNPPPHDQACAVRLNLSQACASLGIDQHVCFTDHLQGETCEDFAATGDVIVHRKDGLYAYLLAATSDDITQNITHVVRGCDLLSSTPQQILLHRILGAQPPKYTHIPVIVGTDLRKLSKQNHAPALDNDAALSNIQKAFSALGLPAPKHLDITSLLQWGAEHWNITHLYQQQSVALDAHWP